MAVSTWDELYQETMVHYGEGRFQEALELMTKEGGRFPQQEVISLYLRSCLAARVGQTDLALDLLDESLGKGNWYGEQVMRESPSWGVLQGIPRFEAAVETCRVLQGRAETQPKVLYAEPANGCDEGKGCPLFLALHGNGEYAQRALDAWRPVTDEGWLLAALQSSQAMASGLYIWDDQEIALREVKEHYDTTREKYSIDEERVIIAGFSMGGETALRVALTGTVRVPGFLLLGPGGPAIESVEEWLPLIREKAGELRGYVLMGEGTQAMEQEAIRRLVEILKSNGMQCMLETIPGLAHDYPRDTAPYLRRALEFIVPKRAT
jgi:predicted esterase